MILKSLILVNEIRMFHNFSGIEIDQSCIANNGNDVRDKTKFLDFLRSMIVSKEAVAALREWPANLKLNPCRPTVVTSLEQEPPLLEEEEEEEEPPKSKENKEDESGSMSKVISTEINKAEKETTKEKPVASGDPESREVEMDDWLKSIWGLRIIIWEMREEIN